MIDVERRRQRQRVYVRKTYKQINFLVKPDFYEEFMNMYSSSGLSKNDFLKKLLKTFREHA